jgi:hypothetical protein
LFDFKVATPVGLQIILPCEWPHILGNKWGKKSGPLLFFQSGRKVVQFKGQFYNMLYHLIDKLSTTAKTANLDGSPLFSCK